MGHGDMISSYHIDVSYIYHILSLTYHYGSWVLLTVIFLHGPAWFITKNFSSLAVLFEHRQVLFAWQPSGNYVASIGEGSRNLFLFDRRGVQVEEVTLKSTAKVTQLEWDKDGEILALSHFAAERGLDRWMLDWWLHIWPEIWGNRGVRISQRSEVVKPNSTLLLCIWYVQYYR